MFTAFSDCSISSHGGDISDLSQTVTTPELVGKMVQIHKIFFTFNTYWEFVHIIWNTVRTVFIKYCMYLSSKIFA
jgi:hypothetical protein